MTLRDFFVDYKRRFEASNYRNETQGTHGLALGILPLFIGAAVFLITAIGAERAHGKTTNMCDQAAHRAASEFGVPFPVLWSITRTETGRSQGGRLRPWPWTVNMEGDGHWFDTEQEALAFASMHFDRGARSFDIGCFQINFKWHGASFRSLDDMFDPNENARYAAAFLARLYRESGNWSEAAGAYHSRTPEFANIYKARFNRIRISFDGGTHTEVAAVDGDAGALAPPAKLRRNSYPLLAHAGSTLGNGSLVPLQGSGASSFIAMPGRLGGS